MAGYQRRPFGFNTAPATADLGPPPPVRLGQSTPKPLRGQDYINRKSRKPAAPSRGRRPFGFNTAPVATELGPPPPPKPLRGQGYIDESNMRDKWDSLAPEMRDEIMRLRDPVEAEKQRVAQERIDRYQAENEATDLNIARPRGRFSEEELDQGTADFRKSRSARDRLLGLSVGKRPGGETIHPMSVGSAGMGDAPSNTNYGGQGDKTNWYIERENFRHDPNTAERQQKLVDAAAIDKFAEASGMTPEEAIAYNGGQSVGASTDSKSRIDALKQIGGLKGAGERGLMDRYVSSESTLDRMDPQARAAARERRAAEKQRKADRLGSTDDPNSIAGRLAARGERKAAERAMRLSERANGPNREDLIIQAAANGNRNALALAGMMAQGNLQRGVSQDRGNTALDVARIQNPQRTDREYEQADRGLYNDYIASGGQGTFQEYMEQTGPGPVGGTPSPSDIADSASLGGLVTGREAQEIEQITANGDPSVIIAYGRAKGWDDEKINKVMAKATGNPRHNTRSPGGWGNFFGNYSTNPDTGEVESDLDRWKRRIGGFTDDPAMQKNARRFFYGF